MASQEAPPYDRPEEAQQPVNASSNPGRCQPLMSASISNNTTPWPGR
jgi:hypothetical protein